MEIQKGRANANKLMGRFLNEMDEALAYAVCIVNGGGKDNAIARECAAEIVITPGMLPEVMAFAAQRQEAYRAEYAETDPDISIVVTSLMEDTFEIMMGDCRRSLLSVLHQIPDGVQKMSSEMEGLVQTSLNLGILNVDFRGIHLTCSVRSSVNAEKQELIQQLVEICQKLGGYCEALGDYPAWEYQADSPLRTLMTDVYTEQYGKKPTVEVIHAGLECGLLSDKLGGADCVSFGPDIVDIHTTREKLSIPSVQRTWNLLLEVLKRCD